MKNKPTIKSILTAIVCISTLMLTSCKNDESFDYPGHSENRIFLKASSGKTAFTAQKTPGGTFTDLKVKIPIFCTSPAYSSIEASMAIDTTYVIKYNAVNKTNYNRLPAEAFNLINSKLTIPAKSYVSQDSLALEIKPDGLENVESGNYLVPIVISSTSDSQVSISQNRNVLYFTLTITEDLDNIWNTPPSDKGTPITGDRTSWTVTTTNSSFGGDTSMLFDNNLNNTLSYSITQLDNTTGFVVDMKQIYTNLSGITMNFMQTYYSIKNADVYTSEDNSQWTMQGNALNTNTIWDLIFYKNVSARYIKLIVRERPTYGIYFREFNVYTK